MAVIRLVAVVAAGIGVHWLPFHSAVYGYHVMQPSSYRHIVIMNIEHHREDYFAPSLGDYVTSVTIYCDRDDTSAASVFDANGGFDIHRSGWITIMGKRYPLIRGEFRSLSGERYTEEQVDFALGGHRWHLTMSYAQRFRNQRHIMLKMLKSFRFRGYTRHSVAAA